MAKNKTDSIIIAPSILSADFACLKDQIEEVEEAGADWLHLDVMDGHFVPNITFGPMVVETVMKLTNCPLDVHLMIANPDQYIQEFKDAGAGNITIHVEATKHLDRTINLIKKTGAEAGVALNPATPLSTLEHVLDIVDLVLIMSVNPGFGGQTFINNALNKLKKTSELIANSSRTIHLEVDGGIHERNVQKVVEAGAEVIVAGSAIFVKERPPDALKAIRRSAELGVKKKETSHARKILDII